MRPHHLHTRFLLAGCLLVLTTAGSGLWSALCFARLSATAATALTDSRQRIDRTAELASALEREDDALLLTVGGDRGTASRTLAEQQQRSDDCYRHLIAVLAGDHETAEVLRTNMDRYRAAGAGMVAPGGHEASLERYHRRVNPLLRQAVATCAAIREGAFESLRQAGVHARDEADRDTRVVAGASFAALALVAAVSAWLARSVVRPVRELTESVDALRRGDFGRRVAWVSADELGRLAEGFNRMAETLAEYRASSLGELLTTKATLEATLDALPDAILVVNPDGGITALNPPARAVLRAAGAAAAYHVRELPLRPEHAAAVTTALGGTACVPPRADFSQALQAVLDGSPRRFQLKAVPIPDFAPQRCGAVIILDDVTEFARLDELRGELIGLASHELKTPLTTLRVHLRLLGEQAGGLTPSQRELLDAAVLGCDELGVTIEEMLDVTRIEAGQLRLEQAPLDLSALVARVVDVLRPRFDDAGVHIRILSEGGPAIVRGDTPRLRTVLINLLSNALKYSPSNSTVTARLSSGGQNAGVIDLEVADTGPGIPTEFRERVFEKFFRVEHHQDVPDLVRGSGIGLYLCREIVKAHGGSIHCQPGEDGAGTRVCLRLPAYLPPA